MALKGDCITSNYKKTRRFYDYSMRLMQKDEFPNEYAIEKNVLQGVLFNNCGHIYYSAQCDSEAASQCFNAVCGIFMQAEQTPGISECIDDEDLAGLLSNVLFQLVTTASAA